MHGAQEGAALAGRGEHGIGGGARTRAGEAAKCMRLVAGQLDRAATDASDSARAVDVVEAPRKEDRARRQLGTGEKQMGGPPRQRREIRRRRAREPDEVTAAVAGRAEDERATGIQRIERRQKISGGEPRRVGAHDDDVVVPQRPHVVDRGGEPLAKSAAALSQAASAGWERHRSDLADDDQFRAGAAQASAERLRLQVDEEPSHLPHAAQLRFERWRAREDDDGAAGISLEPDHLGLQRRSA